jgi:hypothetical protein
MGYFTGLCLGTGKPELRAMVLGSGIFIEYTILNTRFVGGSYAHYS